MSTLTAAEVLETADILALPYAEMMTPGGFLADEGAHAAAVMARGLSRPSYLRKMARLLPKMSRAVPYLSYVLVSARAPSPSTDGQ